MTDGIKIGNLDTEEDAESEEAEAEEEEDKREVSMVA